MDIIESDIKLSGSDIALTPYGDIDLAVGDDNLVQSAVNNMQIVYGELDLRPERGNMAFNRRLKMSDSDLAIVEADARTAIMQDNRVAEVPYVSATRLSDNSCAISFQIKTADGRLLTGGTMVNVGR